MKMVSKIVLGELPGILTGLFIALCFLAFLGLCSGCSVSAIPEALVGSPMVRNGCTPPPVYLYSVPMVVCNPISNDDSDWDAAVCYYEFTIESENFSRQCKFELVRMDCIHDWVLTKATCNDVDKRNGVFW